MAAPKQDSAELIEGMTVQVRPRVLAMFAKTHYRKFVCRVGTVEKLFIPLGGSRQRARVKWQKRGGRGKEFTEIFDVRDLEQVPSNYGGNGHLREAD